MLGNPSLSWERLEDVYYSSNKISQLKTPLTANCQIFVSTISIALIAADRIELLDYKGNSLLSLPVDQIDGDILKLDFDDQHRLQIITNKSVIRVESILPLSLKTIGIPQEVNDFIWDYKKGVLIMKESQDIFYLGNESIELLYKNNRSFTLLTKEHWDCNDKEVIILDINEAYSLDLVTLKLKKLKSSLQWQRATISSEGFVCLFDAKNNKIQIFKSSSQTRSEHELTIAPKEIQWCGDDLIACSFEDEVKLFGPNGSYVSFWYPQDIITVHTEVDGLKIFTSDTIYFLRKVSPDAVKIFEIGSTHPSAVLYDSMELLENRASKAIENLRMIDLFNAVKSCLNAARFATNPLLQKKLLKAASFGKALIIDRPYETKFFVETCEVIKLINSLKNYGIMLTLRQYQKIGFDRTLNILLIRNKFYESFQFCSAFNKKSEVSKVFTKWATTKIALSPDLSDEELLSLIDKQRKETKNAQHSSMANIAQTAFLEGRFKLARDLTLLETDTTKKIYGLLKFDDNNLVLKETLNTHSPELVLSILDALKNNLTSAQFTKLLISNMSSNQLYPYYMSSNSSYLYDYYRQTDSHYDLAQVLLAQGLKQHTLQPFLQQIEDLYVQHSRNPLFAEEINMFKKQSDLWEFQMSLSHTFNQDFTNMTLEKTLERLFELNAEKQLNSLIRKFNINDKRYYHTKCKVLIQQNKISELQTFARSKKSPIGYLPFYNYLKKANQLFEASTYINMIAGISYQQRINMFLECKNYQSAIRLAEKERDVAGLNHILTKIPTDNPQLSAMINEALAQL